MIKRIVLTAAFALSILLTGCSYTRSGSSSEISSSPITPPSEDFAPSVSSEETPLNTHETKGIIACNGRVLDVTLFVPDGWDFDPERNWILVANGKDVADFSLLSYLREDIELDADSLFTGEDSEYTQQKNFIQDGWLNIQGMIGKYYLVWDPDDDREVADRKSVV